MFKIGYRTLKTALGTVLAIFLAQMVGLDNFPSAGILTILCIQKTKKKSLNASWARFTACLMAMVLASILFEVLGYNPISIGLLLLIFIPLTVSMKINEGIVTSSVIILHIYSAGTVSWALLLNETVLITIGIGVALLMNLYMPSLENKLWEYQEQIEKNFTSILMEIVKYLHDNDSMWDGKELTETNGLIADAKLLAYRNVENHRNHSENIYCDYFEMREKQLVIIERILQLVTTIPSKVKQSGILANFLESLSENVHPQNTAIIYLKQLEEMEEVFKEMDLPTTREEFESRAALLHLMKEMEQYLLLKHSFKGLPEKKKAKKPSAMAE